MEPRTLAAIILVAVSGMVLLIGHRIGAGKQLSLIAGLDGSMVRDRDGLARWIGTGLLCIGVLELLISLTLLATSVDPALMIVAYVVVSLLGAAVLLIRMRRYFG
jgi:hypothetical protein